MSTQATTARQPWGRAFCAAGLVVVGVLGTKALIDRTESAAEPFTQTPPTAIDHLRGPHENSPVAATGIAAESVPSSPDEGVAFGPAALETAWAAIRYSPEPGLALIFSHLYPVT